MQNSGLRRKHQTKSLQLSQIWTKQTRHVWYRSLGRYNNRHGPNTLLAGQVWDDRFETWFTMLCIFIWSQTLGSDESLRLWSDPLWTVLRSEHCGQFSGRNLDVSVRLSSGRRRWWSSARVFLVLGWSWCRSIILWTHRVRPHTSTIGWQRISRLPLCVGTAGLWLVLGHC